MLEYWGFPFKLIIDYKGKTIVIKTLQQTKRMETELNNKLLQIVNSIANDTADPSYRQLSVI